MTKKQIQSPTNVLKLIKFSKRAKYIIVVGPMLFDWDNLIFLGPPHSTLIIFIDGGERHRKRFEQTALKYLKNSLVIGDGDSTKAKMDIIKDDQNLSDLDFFLDLLTQDGLFLTQLRSLFFVGFLGLHSQNALRKNRLDHLIFNIASILNFRRRVKNLENASVCMENIVSFYPKGSHTIKIEGPFSFLSLWKNSIKLTGQCEFQLPQKTTITPFSTRGLSNQGNGVINISATEAFFIIT